MFYHLAIESAATSRRKRMDRGCRLGPDCTTPEPLPSSIDSHTSQFAQALYVKLHIQQKQFIKNNDKPPWSLVM